MIKPYYLPADELLRLADENRERFASAKPFPHVVLDDFLPEWVLDTVNEEFPDPGQIPWKEFKKGTSKKLATEGDAFFGDFTRHFLSQLNSAAFLQFLERLSGITSLIPDPYFEGGGLHQIEPGGFLKVHADFSWHDRLHLDRRLNSIIYLNKDWKESYGGALELWERDMSKPVQRYLPTFNRCIVFATTDYAYHGHPDPLASPPGRNRRSLALFYYTNGRPAHETRQDEGSRYQERPGERIQRTRKVVEAVTPPVLVELAKRVARRFR